MGATPLQQRAARPGPVLEGYGWAALRVFDRWWPLVMLAAAPGFVWLNIDALGMQGIYPEYVCFKQAILAGLDPAANTCQSPTFPMWGYGWLLLLTENEFALLLLQNALAVGAAWLFLRELEAQRLLTGATLRLTKALLVVSIPWYALHSLRWPYSLAVSFLLVSLALLMRALRRADPAFGVVALSGLAFGIVLNFRSDYIVLPLVLLLAVPLLVHPAGLQLRRMGIWTATALLALVPWLVYSHAATGHPLLTSTNGGHVLYIGLGQLADNPWGITPVDADPRMHRELDSRFGRQAVSSLTYESDQFLKRRFVELVAGEPTAYGRKVVANVGAMLAGGFYVGEFIQEAECQPRCFERYGFSRDGSARLGPLHGPVFDEALSTDDRIRYLLQGASSAQGRLLSVVGYALVPVAFVLALRRRSLALLVVSVIPLLQAAVNAFGSYLPSYSSNVYLPLLLLVSLATGVISQRAPRGWSRPFRRRPSSRGGPDGRRCRRGQSTSRQAASRPGATT